MSVQQVHNRLLVSPGGGGGGTILTRQTITSGASSTIPAGNYLITFNPASVMASYVLTLPALASDQDIIEIEAGGTILNGTVVTSLTISGTKIESIQVTTIMASEYIRYKFRASNSTWYREN